MACVVGNVACIVDTCIVGGCIVVVFSVCSVCSVTCVAGGVACVVW